MRPLLRTVMIGSALLSAVLLAVLPLAGDVLAAGPDVPGSTKITLVAKELTQGDSRGISITARLTDADRPVGNKPVEFDLAADFFGKTLVNLGTVTTDATGTANVFYQAKWTGIHVLTSRFKGDEGHTASETTTSINFAGPLPEYEAEPIGMVPVRDWIIPLIEFGIIVFWGLLVFVTIRTIAGIRRSRNQAVVQNQYEFGSDGFGNAFSKPSNFEKQSKDEVTRITYR